MGEKNHNLGWRPIMIFAAIVLATFITYALWPQWAEFCPDTEDLRFCTREWSGALAGWVAAIGAAITIIVLWKTLEHMRLSSERQMRAYTYVSSIDLIDVRKRNPRIILVIKNFGQTPAYDLNVQYDYFYGSPDADWDLVSPARSYGIAPPGDEVMLNVGIGALSFPMVNSLSTGRTIIGLKVKLSYIDAFGRERSTETRYANSSVSPMNDGPMRVTGGSSYDE